jgi:hypothetical protein
MTGSSTAPTAVDVEAALDNLLTRAGLPPGQYLSVSPVPAGPGMTYSIVVSEAGEPALEKALLAILGYRVKAHCGSFALYEVEAQIILGAAKRQAIS